MKTEEIIELAKKAGWYISFAGNVFSPHVDADTPVTFEIERLLALHREALISSGELVPREQVEAAVKAEREECANVCDQYRQTEWVAEYPHAITAAVNIANKIRTRSQP